MESLKPYFEIKEDINRIVTEIRECVKIASPYDLMNFLTFSVFEASLNKKSERDYSGNENCILRSVEYIQSVLVSTSNSYQRSRDDIVEQEDLFRKILKLTCDLYNKIPLYYGLWSIEQKGIEPDDKLEYIFYSQLMSLVRGKQYQLFRVPVIKELLTPHARMIQDVYNISIEQLIEGLVSLETNLSQGRLIAIKNVINGIDSLKGSLKSEKAFDREEDHESMVIELQKSLGLDVYDIKKATNWPDKLINDLTLDIGEDTTFYGHDDFGGWPLWNLPIQFKPCIRINDVVYAFDYNTFFDNFYRSFQKSITKHSIDGERQWNSDQKHASENLVERVFASILPGSVIHHANYYPLGSRESAENDLIIEYKDVLFIIEIKAGSYTYTPAIPDYESHKKSLSSIIEKAGKQCTRTKQYIDSTTPAVFYESDKLDNKLFEINNSLFTQTYLLVITLADFNEITASIEKISVVNAGQDVIALSINDLWVYKEYFSSPTEFVHFIKQRTLATHVKEFEVYDELDHLGLYINLNQYAVQAQKSGEGYDMVYFDGYREELDHYFADLYLGISAKRPSQLIPNDLRTILEICERKQDNAITLFTNFLLDLDQASREMLCDKIHEVYRREKETGTEVPSCAFGDPCFFLFVKVPGIQMLSEDFRWKYYMSTFAKSGREKCFLIYISVDAEGNILDVKNRLITRDDIPAEQIDQLREQGTLYAERRKQIYLDSTHKRKIGRNDPCPCGSGKKYKKCCGK